uniref:Uncharacterized protein n=1 Tax=Anguilla anguilla TaxID=7936 RepID=A0A0E9X371_ANGAN
MYIYSVNKSLYKPMNGQAGFSFDKSVAHTTVRVCRSCCALCLKALGSLAGPRPVSPAFLWNCMVPLCDNLGVRDPLG